MKPLFFINNLFYLILYSYLTLQIDGLCTSVLPSITCTTADCTECPADFVSFKIFIRTSVSNENFRQSQDLPKIPKYAQE